MTRLAAILLGLVGTSVGLGLSDAEPMLVDHVWKAQFENGTIDGWASYPAFEDTAYDFTILSGYYRPRYHLQGYVASGEFFYPVELAPPQGPEENRYYLLRAYRPNSASPQRIGMAYKLSLHTHGDSQLSFQYWLRQTAGPAVIQIDLAGADGRRYSHRREAVRARWEEARVRVSDFRHADGPVPEGLEIQAVAIMADFESGDTAVIHHFAVDNVTLNGKCQAGFKVLEPEVQSYDHWPLKFSQRHYHPGQSLDLSVHSEVPGVNEVNAWIEDFDGRAVTPKLPLSKQEDRWVGRGVHRFTEEQPRGPHTLVLEGSDSSSRVSRERIRFWFLDSVEGAIHPRLFFTEDHREVLVQRSREGRGRKLWEGIRERARQGRQAPVPADGQIEYFPRDYLIQQLPRYFEALPPMTSRALVNAFVYVVDKDPEAGKFARDTLLKMTSWNQWVHPWFETQGRKTYYPVGIATLELGIVYDFVYDLLSEEERLRAREGLLRNGVIPCFEEYFVDNRIPNHTSNWISHTTAGPLVALVALYGADGIGNAEPYFSGLAEKFLAHTRATQTPDGGYGEGWGYQNFTMETAWPALAALHKVFGADLAASLFFDRGYLFPTYITASPEKSTTLLDMGDSGGGRGSSSNWAWLCAHRRDPRLKWFYDQGRGNGWEDFLWLDDSTAPESPATLPPSRAFPGKGNVVLRTGWTDRDVVFNYRAGPNFNHTHMDQGHFRLWAFGEDLADELHGGGYYTDPYFWSHFIQASAHSTILVDDNPESQEIGDFQNEVAAFRNHARTEDVFLAEPVGRVTSELGMLYRGQLERATRSFYFVQPGYVVMHDRIRSSGAPHRFQWQLTPPQKKGLSVEDQRAFYQGDKAWLQVEVISPTAPVLLIRDVPIPISEYSQYPERPLRPRAILQVTHKEASTEEDFLVALIPGRTDQDRPMRVERLSGEGYQAVALEFQGRRDEFYFTDAGAIQRGGIETDGRSLFLRREEGRVSTACVEAATRVSVDGAVWLSAGEPLNAAFRREAGGETWWLETGLEATVQLRPEKQGTVQIVEGSGRALDFRDGLQTLRLDAGAVRLRIEH